MQLIASNSINSSGISVNGISQEELFQIIQNIFPVFALSVVILISSCIILMGARHQAFVINDDRLAKITENYSADVWIFIVCGVAAIEMVLIAVSFGQKSTTDIRFIAMLAIQAFPVFILAVSIILSLKAAVLLGVINRVLRKEGEKTVSQAATIFTLLAAGLATISTIGANFAKVLESIGIFRNP